MIHAEPIMGAAHPAFWDQPLTYVTVPEGASDHSNAKPKMSRPASPFAT